MDRAGAEQLEATYVDAGQQGDGQPDVHLHQEGRDEGHTEVNLASGKAAGMRVPAT